MSQVEDKDSSSKRGPAPQISTAGQNAFELAKKVFMKKMEEDTAKPKLKLNELYGYEGIKKEIEDVLLFPREMRTVISIQRIINSTLFFGAPGCGKTVFAEALAVALDYDFLSISASDILDSRVGVNVANLKAIFEVAKLRGHCVLFFGTFNSTIDSIFGL